MPPIPWPLPYTPIPVCQCTLCFPPDSPEPPAFTPPGFFVWNPKKGVPNVKHSTMVEAQAEASRLAAANPGEEFIVLAPKISFTAGHPPIITKQY